SSSVIANSTACRHFAMMPLLVRSDTNEESTNESQVPCRPVSWNRSSRLYDARFLFALVVLILIRCQRSDDRRQIKAQRASFDNCHLSSVLRNASASRCLADPGGRGFCWLSWGAQPDSQMMSKVARMRLSGSAKRSE